MRQLLTPRMIQSMEILQLPLLALEERIEQELQNNPVLEVRDANDDGSGSTEASTDGDAGSDGEAREQFSEEEQPMVVRDDGHQADDFDRLAKLTEYLENEEFGTNDSFRVRQQGSDGERDRKLDAMANTAARGQNLADHLLGQWAFIEAPPEVKKAGEVIINFIDADGYLRTPMDQVQRETKNPPTLEHLDLALRFVQTLEPSGVGARSLQECFLIQLNMLEAEGDEEAIEGHEFDLERKLVADHMKDLEMNRYPQISKKLGREISELKEAVRMLSRLRPHPGRSIGGADSPSVTPDATVWLNEETGRYEVTMAHERAPSLYIRGEYRRMLKERAIDKKTREFISNNVRNARWLIESIEQRSSTIQRVIRAVVDAQQEFFERGPEALKPLPMILVADQLGIHVATVSRAVHEKWIQTPRGIYPLRRFFSGGTTNAEGEDMSWDAVKEKLKVIIDNEDKINPLNDDEIVEKLKEQGIDLARRTVAKYRKILNIPTARQRKEF